MVYFESLKNPYFANSDAFTIKISEILTVLFIADSALDSKAEKSNFSKLVEFTLKALVIMTNGRT